MSLGFILHVSKARVRFLAFRPSKPVKSESEGEREEEGGGEKGRNPPLPSPFSPGSLFSPSLSPLCPWWIGGREGEKGNATIIRQAEKKKKRSPPRRENGRR
ncbi:hypothetical protein AKJ62_04410 [candidate division MSBL1 archaeon SCGC-AAA259D14]|uniref:Uncharacterized protein n=1 Tax=candidate division MSBL1 archaeon SCGC-AAA259D14 TaxID=1698261 RepID=A0A133U3R1_9EURY|nr:hypothetical protein AKJ62_04410 [candidate division MSBL1 archaeon SCGC-AAA259D14]